MGAGNSKRQPTLLSRPLLQCYWARDARHRKGQIYDQALPQLIQHHYLERQTVRPPIEVLKNHKLLIGLSCLGLMISAGLVTLLFSDLGPMIKRQLKTQLPLISARIGREISISSVETRLFPKLHVEIGGLQVNGGEGEPPLIQLERAEVEVDSWAVIRSLGETLPIKAIRLASPKLTLIRYADGRLSYEPLLERIQGESVPVREGSAAHSGEDRRESMRTLRDRLLKLRFGEVTVTGGALELIEYPLKVTDEAKDELAPSDSPTSSATMRMRSTTLSLPEGTRIQRHQSLREISFRLEGESLSDALALDLSVHLGASPAPLQLRLGLDPLPLDSLLGIKLSDASAADANLRHAATSFSLLPAARAEQHAETGAEQRESKASSSPRSIPPIAFQLMLRGESISLEELAHYLPPSSFLHVKGASLTCDLTISHRPGAALGVKGRIESSGIRLQGKQGLGDPIDFELSPDLSLAPEQGTLSLGESAVAFNGVALSARGAVRGFLDGHFTFEGLEVKSEEIALAKILAALPPLVDQLPAHTRLAGPLSLMVRGSGDRERQDLELSFDAEQSTLYLPGQLHKRNTDRLKLSAKLTRSGERVTLHQITLGAADLNLKLRGSLENFNAPRLQLEGDTGRFRINRPARLLPAVRAAIPEDVEIRGLADFSFRLKQSRNGIDGSVRASVTRADLEVPGATLKGSGTLEAQLRGSLGGRLSGALKSELDGLAIEAGEAFRKARNVPLRVDIAFQKSGERFEVPRLHAQFAKLRLQGSGGGDPRRSLSLSLKTQGTRLNKVGPLIQMFPQLAKTPALRDLSLRFALEGRFFPKAPARASITLSDFALKSLGSDLAGSASIARLDQPKLRFALHSKNLDLDQLTDNQPTRPERVQRNRGARRGRRARRERIGRRAQGSDANETTLPPILKAIDLEGQVKIGRGRSGGVPFQKLQTSVELRKGRGVLKRLSLKSYGGAIAAAPLKVNLAGVTPSFSGVLKVKRLNLKPFLKEQAAQDRVLSGLFSTEINLSGRGLDWPTVSKSLAGRFQADLQRGRLHGLQLERAVISALGKMIPGLKTPRRGKGLNLKRLRGAIKLEAGRFKLREALSIQTPRGELNLRGSFGVDLRASLKATLKLKRRWIQKVLRKKSRRGGPIPIRFEISGPLANPSVKRLQIRPLLLVACETLGGRSLRKIVEELSGDREVKAAVRRFLKVLR
ncbi:MAG: AsmA family protein [Myxococcota bacterium]|nr:AsmA family protein [Myxococcota bacterium]